MNCLLLEWKNDIVLIDCGIQFPDASYAGVDLLTPDFQYLRGKLDRLRGIVVTHGHDDHIGSTPYLAQYTELDVYATPFPTGLIQHKLSEATKARAVRYHEIRPRQKFKVGPFEFDPIPVQHSIIEALGFAIKTPVGVIIHSGDFKHDANEVKPGEKIGFEAFKEYGDEGVRLLFSDSTNAERDGHTLSELDIERSFERILSEQTGRLFIALFASNIRRIERLLALARKHDKRVALAGRSMHAYLKLAFEQSSMKLPEDTIILLEDAHQYQDQRLIFLLTGSQAEPQSALVRVAAGENKNLQIRNGDRVILSSRFIPGNERNINQMIDQLYRLGAEVTYESFHQIHVSGHGFQDELMMMLNAVRPQAFVPIHGEYRHLSKHRRLARHSGVANERTFAIEDGQWLQLTKKELSLGTKLELQKGVVVGGNYMTASKELFVQKNNLAKTGIVFVAFARDKRKRLMAQPRVGIYGVMFRQEENAVQACEEIEKYLAKIYGASRTEEDLEDIIRLEVRRFFRKRASHKPAVVSVYSDI